MAQQGQSSSAKGNPAHRRMGNATLKALRERSWRRGEARKTAHREAQEVAAADNRVLRAQGLPTPWEQAQMVRAEVRAARRAGIPVGQAKAREASQGK